MFGGTSAETPGWSVHRFSVSRRQWVEVSSSDAANTGKGLFRFVLKHQRFYYLRWRNCSYRVPVQVGKYAIIRRRLRVIEYDPGRRALSTFPAFRPPLLIERAPVLCSGKLNGLDPVTGRIEYTVCRCVRPGPRVVDAPKIGRSSGDRMGYPSTSSTCLSSFRTSESAS